jgi:hypothetical protein
MRYARHDKIPTAGAAASPHIAMPHRVITLSLAVSFLVAGCTGHRASARVEKLRSEIGTDVPVGTSIDVATQYFSQRGLRLKCCMTGPNIHSAYTATEHGIGRTLWVEYSALVVVDVSDERRVTRVRVMRVGLGL